MLAFFSSLFSSGIVGSIEKVALEAITTDKESAEAKTIMLKALDPNGKMRRDLSRFASRAYGFYLASTTILVFMHAFGFGEAAASKEAMEAMAELFLPITASWASIVAASFGVNATNTVKGGEK